MNNIQNKDKRACDSKVLNDKNMLINGLTQEEVSSRIKENKVNGNYSVKTKSIPQIIFTNLFSLFNIVNVFLALCIFLVHSYKNMLFMGVVFWNAFIGIFQEIRSKRVIDRLSLLSSPVAHVLREGKEEKIKLSDIVLDDIIIVKNGFQVCADAVIMEGECEVNESLLTGESDPISKKKGDEILSGSFVTAGEVKAKVIHVGKDNYVNTITGKAKYLKKPNSQINSSIKAIVKFITICLIPITALLFYNQYKTLGMDLKTAVVGTVAAVIGMIPSGLVLLTSVVLAVSVIRLSKKNTLVQEMFCIETLARVDVLCLDKTGTITEGSMNVEEIKITDEAYTTEEIKYILKRYTIEFTDDNPTFNALRDYATTQIIPEQYVDNSEELLEPAVTGKVPFSSDKKWGAIKLGKHGTFVIGAMEYILKEPSEEILNISKEYSEKGLRVLIVAHTSEEIVEKIIPENTKTLAVISITDKIREEAYDTIAYFKKQGVNVKVISGDNPETVSYIAKKVGIRDGEKYIDTSKLTDEELAAAANNYSVFGRVRPDQKLTLVKALKAQEHVVAMTGDGVNDVLALKEADCSIAMQSGSDAARNVSQLVLMDSNFASMPHIVAEGRRTINNMQRSAALYLTKTIYSTLLAIVFVFLSKQYPFIPIQLTLIGALSIGIPSFILALEPNVNRVKGKFITNVLRLAIPGGIVVFGSILVAMFVGYILNGSKSEISTLAILGLALAALTELYEICKPLNKMRRTMLVILSSIFVISVIFFKNFFGFASLSLIQWLIVFALFIGETILFRILVVFTESILGTTPNIYHVAMGYVRNDKDKIMIINDDVDSKDYFDITTMMKNIKILGLEKVTFLKTPKEGGDIRVEGEDDICENEIAINALYYVKKIKKIKKGKVMVRVETCDEKNTVEAIVNIDESTVNLTYDDEQYDIKAYILRNAKITL